MFKRSNPLPAPARHGALALAASLAFGGSAQALVINEVDYDQPGTDRSEFVEIFNEGNAARSLSGLSVRLVNGNTSTEYTRIALPALLLPAGGYFVLCNAGSAVANCNLAALGAQDAIQNGAPDGIALVDDASGSVLSSLSYEGSITAATLSGIPGTFNLVNGSPTPVADNNTQAGVGLSRVPNGVDTQNDLADWQLAAITPGAANAVSAVPEPAVAALWLAGLGVLARRLRVAAPSRD